MIAALRARNFRYLWAGQFISQFGNVFLEVAALWLLQLRSPLYLTIAGVVMTGPALLAMFGGALVDQLGPRRLMILTDVLRAVGVGLMAFLVAFDPPGTPVYLLIALGVTSLGGALFSPSQAVLIPEIVEGDALVSGNGLMQTTSSTAATVGYALGGAFLVTMGGVVILGFDALTYALSAVSILLVTVKAPPKVASTAGTFSLASLREGYAAIASLRWFVAIVPVAVALNMLLNGAIIVLPYWVHHLLHGSAATYGLLIASWTVGQIAGSLLAGAFARFPLRRLVVITSFVQGGLLLVFALWTSALPEGFIFVLTATTNAVMNAPIFAIFQKHIPAEVRGKAFGVLQSLMMGAAPLGPVIVGLTIGVLPLQWPWIASAALLGVLAVQFRAFRELDAGEGQGAFARGA